MIFAGFLGRRLDTGGKVAVDEMDATAADAAVAATVVGSKCTLTGEVTLERHGWVESTAISGAGLALRRSTLERRWIAGWAETDFPRIGLERALRALVLSTAAWAERGLDGVVGRIIVGVGMS